MACRLIILMICHSFVVLAFELGRS